MRLPYAIHGFSKSQPPNKPLIKARLLSRQKLILLIVLSLALSSNTLAQQDDTTAVLNKRIEALEDSVKVISKRLRKLESSTLTTNSYRLSAIATTFPSIDSYRQQINQTLGKYDVPERRNNFTSAGILNYFFANKVSSYLGSSGNLAVSRAFAVLNNADGRLFLGGTFSSRKNKADRLSTLLQLGLKSNLKDQFSTLFKDEEIQNDIGIGMKFTWIINGTLKMTDTQVDYLKWFRERELNIANDKYSTKLQALDKGYLKIASDIKADDTLTAGEHKVKLEQVAMAAQEAYASASKEFDDKYLEEEYNFIKDNRNYTYSITHWVSIEGYLPLTQSVYKFSQDPFVTDYKKEFYSPYQVDLAYSALWSHARYGELLMSIPLSVLKNNTVKANRLTPLAYNEFLNQGGADTLNLAQLKNKTEDVYAGEFKEFMSFKAGLEGTYFFGGDFTWVGLSGSFDYLMGDVSALNWKLGIPLRLNDDKGKPTVSFELQWREQYKQHTVGIGVGVAFSNIIY